MALTAFEFQQARVKQVVFKSRLRSVLYGVRAADATLFSFADNPLGQWLQTKLAIRAGLPANVQELHRSVRQMLDTGQELATRYQDGQVEEARAGLARLDTFTDRIEELLRQLEEELLAS